jgi:hypothetical protein
VWNRPDYSNATEIAQSGDRRGETVSAQTVPKVTRDLDEAVREFHQARWRRCLSLSRWRELAGMATDGTQAGADAGGVWHPPG